MPNNVTDANEQACPKCGAAQVGCKENFPDWACGSSGVGEDMWVQSDACTIAALKAQLAEVIENAANRCETLERRCSDLDAWKTLYDNCANSWQQQKVEIASLTAQLAERERQLADARLLAKAALHDMADTDGTTVHVYNQPSGERFEATLDASGLPILTHELRTALEKAIGE